MDFVASLPLVVWIGIVLLALAFMVAGAVYMFLNGLSHYNKAVELDGLNHNIKAAEERYKQLSAERENLSDELARAHQTISDGKAAKEWLEAHGGELAAKQATLARIDGDINAYQARKDKLAKEVDALQTQMNEQNATLQKARLEQLQANELKNFAEQARQKAEDDLKALKNDITVATAERDALQKEVAELRPLEGKVKGLREEVARLELKRDALQKEVAQLLPLEAKVKGLREEVTYLEPKRDALQKEVAQLRPLEERAKALREEVARLEPKRDALQQKIEAQEVAVAKLNGEAAAAQRILEELSGVRREQASIWADLETAVIKPPAVPRADVKDCAEVDWLKAFTHRLNASGFQFNPRIINAFHTGLKCGDISPLVVLAGISGTGKSLLPELYAAAAGMNFLAVPIQPRWDSPQDLFGFFNYMEGRYKATELARFLWQVDRFNNKHALRDDSLSIVLLDEMNLARVEYYFSDLLSKLEMRRGLSLGDPIERAKAEIVIEGNTGTQGNNARYLFIGPDVFFVGTMNEDETTQMLSDKVVDRSNIMRFGKPSKMAQAPDKTAILSAFAKTPRLTRARWEAWKEKGKAENVSRFDHVAGESLKRLNAAFERIGRPFGHRVWQAVTSYITHYPSMTVGNIRYDERTAFADQLEMKILPKLNGIELSAPNVSQVMADISGVLAKLDDDKLSEAFDAAKDPNVNTFFKWRGVMR